MFLSHPASFFLSLWATAAVLFGLTGTTLQTQNVHSLLLVIMLWMISFIHTIRQMYWKFLFFHKNTLVNESWWMSEVFMCEQTEPDRGEKNLVLIFCFWTPGGWRFLYQLGFFSLSLCGEGPGFWPASGPGQEEDHIIGSQPPSVPGARSRQVLLALSKIYWVLFSLPNVSLLNLVLCVQDPKLEYECVLIIEGQIVLVDAYVEADDINPSHFYITCQLHQVWSDRL